jgi:osmoprotectant transport system ATP-binding protein
MGAPLSSAIGVTSDGWVLVSDDDNAPIGWLATAGVPASAMTGVITPDLLNLGGTIANAAGTLREALDSALSSPSGRGVVVDDDGRLLGTVTTAAVVALIEQYAHEARAHAARLAAPAVAAAAGSPAEGSP